MQTISQCFFFQQIRFEGVRGPASSSDIALDMIEYHPTRCADLPPASTHVTLTALDKQLTCSFEGDNNKVFCVDLCIIDYARVFFSLYFVCSVSRKYFSICCYLTIRIKLLVYCYPIFVSSLYPFVYQKYYG